MRYNGSTITGTPKEKTKTRIPHGYGSLLCLQFLVKGVIAETENTMRSLYLLLEVIILCLV